MRWKNACLSQYLDLVANEDTRQSPSSLSVSPCSLWLRKVCHLAGTTNDVHSHVSVCTCSSNKAPCLILTNHLALACPFLSPRFVLLANNFMQDIGARYFFFSRQRLSEEGYHLFLNRPKHLIGLLGIFSK